MHPNPKITLGFYLAGAINILGILLFSLAWTNVELIGRSPRVFSPFGILAVILWGLAYLSVARTYHHVPKLIAVFALEKLFYVITWMWWQFHHAAELPALYQTAPLTATFFTLYGPLDLAFGLFFAAVALRTNPKTSDN
jgi:hypothetical protein